MFIVGLVIYAALLVDIYYYNHVEIGSAATVTVFGVVWGIYLLVMIVYKYWDRNTYIFTADTIQGFKGKKQLYRLNTKDITLIRYVRFDVRYAWKRIKGDPMLDGDACKLYVFMKNGNMFTLGPFSARDVKKIDNLYGDLLEII